LVRVRAVLGRLGSDGALGQAGTRAQCSGEFVKGYETVAAMTDAPNEMVLCRDLELKLDSVGGVMPRVLQDGLLAGCRKNCRFRLAALMAELLPCGVVSAGRGTIRRDSP